MIHCVIQLVVEVVRHCVDVDEHTQVDVDVTIVSQAVLQEVVEVVSHVVVVEEHLVV